VRPNAGAPAEVDFEATFTFLESRVGAAGVRAVRPGLEVRSLLGRRIRTFGIVRRCTELRTLFYCLGICTTLEKVSNNIMVQQLCCSHQGRAAIIFCSVHVCTELINQTPRHIEVSHLCCHVQGRAATLCASIDVSATILGQRAHDS
jgi:hypothetical protein